MSTPAGAGTPSISAINTRTLTQSSFTISNLTHVGLYTFVGTAFNGNGAGTFLEDEYACSGITGPLTDTFYVRVEAQIDANAGSDQVFDCAPPLTLQGNDPSPGTGLWTIISEPVGSTATLINPANPNSSLSNLNQTGTYVFRWTITTEFGSCVSSDDVQVIVNEISPDGGADQTVCGGSTTSLSAINPLTGTWTAAAENPAGATLGATTSGTASVSFSNSSSGDYFFVYTSGTCTDTVKITATPQLAVTASTPQTLCINTALSPDMSHTTTGATGIGTPTGLPAGVTAVWAANTINISGTPTDAGTFNYSIPLTGSCGTVSATGTIEVVACVCVDEPTVAIASDSNVCLGDLVTLTGTFANANNATWSIVSGGGSLSTTNCDSSPCTTVYTPGATGTVVIRLITDDPDDTGPCTAAEAEHTLIVRTVPVLGPIQNN